VPVTGAYSKYCPFLLESDTLSLSKEFHLQTAGLKDGTLGITHDVVSPGEHILLLLETGTELRQIQAVAIAYGIRDTQLAELFGFLNLVGALKYKRQLPGRLHASVLKLRDLCLSIFHSPFSWRRPSSLGALLLGIFRATLPLSIATLAVSFLFMYAGVPAHSTAAVGIGLFLGSLGLHEATHIAVARHFGRKTALLQRGLRLGVIHPRLPVRGEILSALAGPLAGIVCCLAVGIVLYISGQRLLAFLCGTISLFHLSSLLPWYGDGASLRAARREART
jgi:hypothetical protein